MLQGFFLPVLYVQYGQKLILNMVSFTTFTYSFPCSSDDVQMVDDKTVFISNFLLCFLAALMMFKWWMTRLFTSLTSLYVFLQL